MSLSACFCETSHFSLSSFSTMYGLTLLVPQRLGLGTPVGLLEHMGQCPSRLVDISFSSMSVQAIRLRVWAHTFATWTAWCSRPAPPVDPQRRWTLWRGSQEYQPCGLCLWDPVAERRQDQPHWEGIPLPLTGCWHIVQRLSWSVPHCQWLSWNSNYLLMIYFYIIQ